MKGCTNQKFGKWKDEFALQSSNIGVVRILLHFVIFNENLSPIVT